MPLVRRDVEDGTAEDHRGNAIGVGPIVLERQDRSPRMSQNMPLGDAEVGPQRIQLLHKMGDREQGRVGRRTRLPAS